MEVEKVDFMGHDGMNEHDIIATALVGLLHTSKLFTHPAYLRQHCRSPIESHVSKHAGGVGFKRANVYREPEECP